MSEIRPGAPLNEPSRTPALQIIRSMLDALPSSDRTKSREHPATKQYSIFLPVERTGVPTYTSLMGNVIETGRFSSNRVDLSSSEQLPDMTQIPIGSYVTTLDTPNNLGGLAYRALSPIGIEALSRAQSVIGTSYRDMEGHNYIAVFEQPFPEVPQEKRDELGARFSTTRFLIDADEQLVSALARQDFTGRAPQIEMNRFFHTIDGNNPAIEDLLHRFGSFDLRLLFPSLQELNASSLSFQQLQALYPERIAALREGYVTMDRLRLEPVPEELIPQDSLTIPVQGNDGVFLPTLTSLYKIYELKQAGFAIKLAEAEAPSGYIDADKPTRKEFAVMAKPLS